jgi:hypothetical protein
VRALWCWLACLASCGRSGFEPGDALASDVRGSGADSSVTAWQFADVNSVMNVGALTLQLPLSTPGTGGELIVLAVQHDPGGVVLSVSDNASSAGTYQAVPNAAASNVNGALELWYGQGANPGATTVTAIANTYIHELVAWRFVTPRLATLDTSGGATDQPSSPTPTSPALMTAAAGEIVVAATYVDGNVSGLAAGSEFTNDVMINGDAYAHLTDPHAPAGVHIVVWNQDQILGYCASAAAFAVGP